MMSQNNLPYLNQLSDIHHPQFAFFSQWFKESNDEGKQLHQGCKEAEKLATARDVKRNRVVRMPTKENCDIQIDNEVKWRT
jgi:hypothetical protein